MKSDVSVTTVIPFYNSDLYIQETLESVFASMSIEDSIIIVNDGSNTNSTKKLRDIVAGFSSEKVTILSHLSNLGGASARNTGITASETPWILMLDSDNVIPMDFFAKFKSEARSSNADVYYPPEIKFFKSSLEKIEHSWNFRHSNLNYLDHLRGPYVPSSSGNYFFKKSSYDYVGGYPIHSRALDSWGFGLKLSVHKQIFRAIPGTYYWHRFGHDSYFTNENSRLKQKSLNLIATSLVLERPELVPEKSLRLLTRRGMSLKWYSDILKNPLKVDAEPFGCFTRN